MWKKFRRDNNDLYQATQEMFSLLDLDDVIQ